MQDLDDFEFTNLNLRRLSLAPASLDENIDIMCVPGTPKLTSVDSLCRHEELSNNKNEDCDADNMFLHRVVFDRDEILRKHYQIEKTDKELIEETLDHFSKKQTNENKILNADTNKAAGFKSKLKFPSKKFKSIEHCDKIEKSTQQKNGLNGRSVTEIVDLINKKKRHQLKIKIEPNTHAANNSVSEANKAIVAFKDLPNEHSGIKRFKLKDREVHFQNSKSKYDSIQKPTTNDKMEFSIDNQLLKRFDETQFDAKPNEFVVDHQFIQSNKNNTTYEDQSKKSFSISFDNLEYKNKLHSNEIINHNKHFISSNNKQSITVISSNDQVNKHNPKNFNRRKFHEVEQRILKTEIMSSEDEVKVFSNRLAKLTDVSSCESAHKEVCNPCHCHKFKAIAEKMGMRLDDKFIERVQTALLQQAKLIDEHQSEVKVALNYKLKLLNKRTFDNIDNIQKDRRGVTKNKENAEENGDSKSTRAKDANIKARIDKLRAFKKYFMKTEHGEQEEKIKRRKKSNDLNTFR